MIVPQSRLLFWVGMVVLPFATLGAVVPSAVELSVAMIGLLFALTLLDAALAYKSLDGISVEFPEVVRLSKDRKGTIEVRIKNNRTKTKQLRMGLAFPQEIYSPNEDLLARLPAGIHISHFNWPCTPVKRGCYLLDKCYIEGTSLLGFWAVRASVPVYTEIRVYPNLFPEQKNLAALFLSQGNFGIHSQRQVGQGRDFEKLREYIYGDSYDQIHWKATAKRGHPITKVFQIERTQEVYVIIDASRLSARRTNVLSAGKNIDMDRHNQYSEVMLEQFITAALIMGVAAEQQGDRFGILTFSNKVHSFIRAKTGRAHYNNCRDVLYTLQPQIVTPDFDDLCTFISLRLRRRALLIFLTNMDDPVLAESFVQNMDLIRRKHLILVNMLRPAGAQPLFSHPDVKSLNDVYRNLGGHVLLHNLLKLEKLLQQRGVHFSLLNNEKMCAQVVSQYIGVKQRQLL